MTRPIRRSKFPVYLFALFYHFLDAIMPKLVYCRCRRKRKKVSQLYGKLKYILNYLVSQLLQKDCKKWRIFTKETVEDGKTTTINISIELTHLTLSFCEQYIIAAQIY